MIVEPGGRKVFDLCLRIPGWCRDAQTPGGLYSTIGAGKDDAAPTLKINGRAVAIGKLDRGYCRIKRTWAPGDTVELHMPMPIRRIRAHPKITADVSRVALQRGPIVYCVEAVDHGGHVRHLFLDSDAKLTAEHRPKLLGGVTVLTGKATARIDGADTLQPVDLLAIPYYAWDNRTGGEMAVWLPTAAGLAQAVRRPTIASRARPSASHCHKSDAVRAMNDQIDPPDSGDLNVPRHTWWPHLGTAEWVQYDLAAAATVSSVEVYWFDDRKTGQCRVPASWRLLARVGDKWRPVTGASTYAVKLNAFNRVTFDPIETSALRIEVQLQKDFSGGVLEWRVSK